MRTSPDTIKKMIILLNKLINNRDGSKTFGLCKVSFLLNAEGKINDYEYELFKEDLKTYGNTLNNSWTFDGIEFKKTKDNNLVFYWHPMDYQSRLDFLEVWLKELSDN